MNPIALELIKSLLRSGGKVLGGILVARGIWTADESSVFMEFLIGGLSLAVASAIWSLWVVVRGRIKFLTALAMPVGATENDVKALIKEGAPTPPVSTHPDSIPVPGGLPVSDRLM